MKPLFSIIVVSYNAGQTIKTTIESILKQDLNNYEIIVKDACSTDDTIQNIPENDKIKFYQTKDCGIYGGMNEAIGYSSGEYLLFLNCGDYFYNEQVLSKISEFLGTVDADVVYGNYCRKEVVFNQPSVLTKNYFFRTPLCHQTIFYKRSLFEEFGGYDLKYKICADCDFNLKIFCAGKRYFHCDCIVSDYLGGGASETEKGIELNKKEYKEILGTYFTKKEIRKNKIKMFFTFRKLRKALISDKSPKWLRRLYRKAVNKVNG